MTNDQAIEVANGNQDAYRYIISLVRFFHMMDDIVDGDKPVDDKRLARETVDFLRETMVNPFVAANSAILFVQITLGVNSWLDANDWEKSRSKVMKRDADVVKSGYHEILFAIAFLTGGLEHLKSVTTKYRHEFLDHDFQQLGRT